MWFVLAAALLFPGLVGAQTKAVRIEWDGNGDNVTFGYFVLVGLQPGSPVAVVDAGLATHATLPLPTGGRYYVAVAGYGADRRMGIESVEIEVDLASVPSSPQELVGSIFGSVATLSWGQPLRGGLPVHYELFAGTAPGAADIVAGASVGPATSVAGALPPGLYYARVRAVNLVGEGPFSEEVSLVVSPPPPPPPPSSLSVTWTGRRARLSWAPAIGAVPVEYIVEAGSQSGSADVGAFRVGAETSFVADVPSGTYFVRVRAVVGSSASEASNELVLQ